MSISRFRPEGIDFVRRNEPDWRWRDNMEIRRRIVSVVAVGPTDQFEVARPTEGVTIRVRCAWENTAQGLPRSPIAELVSLTVEGESVRPTLVAEKRAGVADLRDQYHRHHIPAPAHGKHKSTAVVRRIATGEEASRSITFEVGP